MPEDTDRMRRLAEENAAMAEIGRIISASLDIDEVYERFAEQVRKLIPYERLSIGIINAEASTFSDTYTAATVHVPERGGGVVNKLEGSLTLELARTRKGAILHHNEEGEWMQKYPLMMHGFRAGLRTTLSVPLVSRDQVIGALHIQTTRVNAYSERDLVLAERVAAQIAGAIANALLFKEHERSEAALRESERRFQIVLDNSPDGLFLADPEGKLTTVNASFCKLVGVPEGECCLLPFTHHLSEFLSGYDDSRHAELVQKLNTGNPITQDWDVLKGKDGQTVPVEIRFMLIDFGFAKRILGLVRDVTERRKAHNAVVRQARELAVLEERNRLAREMHDTLAQGFTGILLQLEAAEQALTQAPAEAAEHLNKARTLARESLQEARRSVWNLRPQALDNRSLEAALREEVRRFNADGGAQASFSVIGDRLPLPGGVDACLLRICQESLSNVRKHAKASNISIVLAFEDGHVRLTVRDDGVGFDSVSMKTTQSIQGLGLTSMEERVQFLDGTIDILSEPGKGTRVEVRVPTGAPPEVSSASEA